MSPPASILTLVAHPDDAELWAGGSLARHARAGARITVALPPCDQERGLDVAAGAGILGAVLRLVEDLSVPAVRALLGRKRPEVASTHSPEDIHPDHQMTARIALAALPTLIPEGRCASTSATGTTTSTAAATRSDCPPLWTSSRPGAP